MEQLVDFLVSIVDSLGTTVTLFLCLIVFGFLLLIIYLTIVFESYSRSENIFTVLKFKKYKINVINKGEILRTFTVRAFGKIHASEKVAKKIRTRSYQSCRITFCE